MYSILGQDYKHSHLPHVNKWSSSRPSGKGRGFYADEDAAYDDDDGWSYMAEDDDMAYYEYDDGSWDNDEYADFDADAAYFQESCNDPADDDYGFDPAEYDECFASYMDARKRFNELRMSRGFFPVVYYTTPMLLVPPTLANRRCHQRAKVRKARARGVARTTSSTRSHR